MKSKTTAYLLWLFLGLLGVHKFYLKKTGVGILYLCTAGLFFIGWVIDLFTLGKQVDRYNENPPLKKPVREQSRAEASIEKTVFITYEDAKENYSDRLIEVHRLYKKGSDTYIDAYCFLSDGDRTFRLDRILSMREGNRKGREIPLNEMEIFLTELFTKKAPAPSVETLAADAIKDTG